MKEVFVCKLCGAEVRQDDFIGHLKSKHIPNEFFDKHEILEWNTEGGEKVEI